MTTVSHVRRIAAGVVLATAALVVGCTQNPSAEFAWNEATLDLLPEPRRALQKSMLENFGTPEDLVAWERMPVSYLGTQGTITATEATTSEEKTPLAANQIRVELEGESASVVVGEPLMWIAGNHEPVSVSGVSMDGKTLTLSAVSAVSVGDKFAVEQLKLGRKVYMKNCLHCHGVAGDGAGPTARYLNPRPRDYRLGVFKFTETLATERITRVDLWRTIKYGIPGTYMPSFLLLDDAETHAVVEYVRWLAMRGELEKRMGDELVDYSVTSIKDTYEKAMNSYKAALDAGEKPEKAPSLSGMAAEAQQEVRTYLKEDFADTFDGTADFIADLWTRAEDPASVITPKVPRVADTASSRANGRLLYLSDKAKCYTCHGSTGLGNGGATEDFWPKPGSTEKYDKRGLHDVWGNQLEPRNLRLGQYRGGRRPVDIFRRIYAGIKGTPMPAFGGTVLKDEEIWDLVNYVMSLPYESESTVPQPAASQVAARQVQ